MAIVPELRNEKAAKTDKPGDLPVIFFATWLSGIKAG